MGFVETFLNWEVMARYAPKILEGTWVTIQLALAVYCIPPMDWLKPNHRGTDARNAMMDSASATCFARRSGPARTIAAAA